MLLSEVLDVLAPKPGETMADGTSGRGGHAAEIAKRVAPGGTIVLNDLDDGNLAYARDRVVAASPDAEVVALLGNFAEVPRTMIEQGRRVDGLLLDLGFSSTQMDTADRGFSFMRDGPLDMRYDRASGVSAAEYLASVPEDQLADILRQYGEEPRARVIARKLVEHREHAPIQTTSEFARIVADAVGGRASHGRIHPATKAFQALRIAVNDELASLRSVLESVGRSCAASKRGTGQAWLEPGARIVVISFHSLEDRLVKRSFADLVSRGLAAHLTRKPAEAGEAEVTGNPRSRSAKLRAIRIS